jgi:hypothetical protein
MIRCDEPTYSMRKPPILLVARKVQFTCLVCQRSGEGPPWMKVHAGRCRIQHSRNLAKRSIERNKKKHCPPPEEAAPC